jgi:hypothetical protein
MTRELDNREEAFGGEKLYQLRLVYNETDQAPTIEYYQIPQSQIHLLQPNLHGKKSNIA